MLHELLLALLGYTGDLIIDEREHLQSHRINLSPDAPLADGPTFKLASDIYFIQPSDREVIEMVITLGFYYRELERFAAKSRNLSWIRSSYESPLSRVTESLKGEKANPSVYQRAIANGIVEVLSVYRSAVLHIEQKLLADSVHILATVTQGLNKMTRMNMGSLLEVTTFWDSCLGTLMVPVILMLITLTKMRRSILLHWLISLVLH